MATINLSTPRQLNEDAKSVQIYVGRLVGEVTPSLEEWTREIAIAENLLVHAHSLALNSHFIETIPSLEFQICG